MLAIVVYANMNCINQPHTALRRQVRSGASTCLNGEKIIGSTPKVVEMVL
jgi:hypothetical protein